ncbi:hypothetical protein [Bradyrhizobium sp. SZCCHNS3053]|uniref:hypothetical protein n=1 Tax=Bradyrhizobium sp. SZCCHNS3053 TaxID=3057322 RepID=UPI002916FECB|nr:hypothetical protein [Bradyrhizobium sp. SZCCHNS3053]
MSNILEFKPIQRERQAETHDAEIAIRLTDWHAERCAKRERFQPTTETGMNLRERQRRDDAWRRAKTAVDYWRAKMEFEDAWINAARVGTVTAPKPGEISTRDANVRAWREALVALMMTPAPSTAAVAWKKRTLASGQHKRIGAETGPLDRAIERDEAWLKEHPVRRPRPVDPAAVTERKQANDDIRHRIKEVAASLNLSTYEIRPALTLQSRKVCSFIQEHGISADWLLTGEGRVFEIELVNH